MLFTFDNKGNDGSLNRNNLSNIFIFDWVVHFKSTTDETRRYYSLLSLYISMILFSSKQQSIDNYN